MVSSIGSSGAASMARMSRPDPAQMAGKLFARLDTKGQGFIEQSDLQSALGQAMGNAAPSTDARSDSSALFSALDGDSNGKVTESEFSSGLQKLAEALDSQAAASRVGGHGGGMPPPPPKGAGGGDEGGFTLAQLQGQLDQAGSTDSQRTALVSSVVSNFDKADTDGDGKVSRAEALAYEQSQQGASSSSGSAGSASEASSRIDARVAHQLMALMRSYGTDSAASAAGQGVSVSA